MEYTYGDNAFKILAVINKRLKRSGLDYETVTRLIESYNKEAQDGDYDHLYDVSEKYRREFLNES